MLRFDWYFSFIIHYLIIWGEFSVTRLNAWKQNAFTRSFMLFSSIIILMISFICLLFRLWACNARQFVYSPPASFIAAFRLFGNLSPYMISAKWSHASAFHKAPFIIWKYAMLGRVLLAYIGNAVLCKASVVLQTISDFQGPSLHLLLYME